MSTTVIMSKEHKKSSKVCSPRRASPGRKDKSPVVIAEGEPTTDPRQWRAPDTVQMPDSDVEKKISRLVAEALAKALPAAFAAPANTQGRAPASVDLLTHSAMAHCLQMRPAHVVLLQFSPVNDYREGGIKI